MESLGQRLKEYRTANKLTIDEFVEKYNKTFHAHISKSMVSRWENNLAEPKIQVGKNIAIMYSISFEELVGISEPKNTLNSQKKTAIDTIAAHLEGKEITEDKVKQITDFIDFIFRD